MKKCNRCKLFGGGVKIGAEMYCRHCIPYDATDNRAILLMNHENCVGDECDHEYSCEEYGCDSICRCSKIIDWRAKSINIRRIIDSQWKDATEIEKYAINRILNHSHFVDPDYWEPDIGPGYYGEEIRGVFFEGDTELLGQKITQMLEMKSEAEKVEFILANEYGYLLDELKDRSWHIEEINRQVVQMNQEYKSKIDIDKRDVGTDILGIVVAVGNGRHYRLIDGFHRTTSCKESTGKFLVAS